MARITPRHKQKPPQSANDFIDLISEGVAALLGNEKSQRIMQQKTEHHTAHEYFEGNRRRTKR